jgi:hypothetical protein
MEKTNEKRGGLTVILFSNKYVQSSSCDRYETAQRTLFLLFANNNCLPITLHCKKEVVIFPSPAGMSLTKLSLGRKKLKYSRPGRV